MALAGPFSSKESYWTEDRFCILNPTAMTFPQTRNFLYHKEYVIFYTLLQREKQNFLMIRFEALYMYFIKEGGGVEINKFTD